jgi:hypothetical protein
MALGVALTPVQRRQFVDEGFCVLEVVLALAVLILPASP